MPPRAAFHLLTGPEYRPGLRDETGRHGAVETRAETGWGMYSILLSVSYRISWLGPKHLGQSFLRVSMAKWVSQG